MFREALKTGFYDLQAARDEYKYSFGAGGLNRDLVWQFMDIQTRLITPICSHYGEYVWRELLTKEGFAIKADWPSAELPNLTLKSANKYLQGSIGTMRKLHQKQTQGSKKGNKKGAQETQITEAKDLTGLIYVNEKYDGWNAECLRILQSKFNSETRTFPLDSEIMASMHQSEISKASNLKQIQKLCMPFFWLKKDEILPLGPEALDLKLPFGEHDVLSQNKELIKRQLGVEDIEVLSVLDPEAVAKAGALATGLNRNLVYCLRDLATV